MYIFFDCETNGQPIDKKARMYNLGNWPRVIQLAWQVANEEGELLKSECHLIRPDGWEIPKEKFWTDHGFSTEKNSREGKPIAEILDMFIGDYEFCEWLVAHNIGFDYPVLGAEMIRAGKKASVQLPRFCTMLETEYFCRIPGVYGHKWPKLKELYQITFNKKMEGEHDAGRDVTAVRECFFELKKRKIITLKTG